MKRFLLFILLLIAFLPLSEGYAACDIDGKLSPKLAEYESNIRKAFGEFRQGAQNRCGPTNGGSIASMNKSIELFDKAMLQIPVYGDIVIDFQYNTVMAFRGESRSAVTINGELFQKIMSRVINPTIDALANTCSLTDTNQEQIVEYIRVNYLLESVYKSVAVGTIRSSEGIPEKYMDVYNEIVKTYNPEATASCKNEYNFEDTMSKALDSFSNGTFGIANAWDDWKQAIALFSGQSNNGKYQDIARKLLKQELARQGMSKGASDIIVSNFDCVRARESGDSTLTDDARAIADCKKNPIIGLDKLKDEYNRATKKATNTEDFIKLTMRSQDLITDVVNVNLLYAKFISEASSQTKINEKLLKNLIDMHIGILSANAMIEKRIPVMQKNCMKALPEVVGGCRKGG